MCTKNLNPCVMVARSLVLLYLDKSRSYPIPPWPSSAKMKMGGLDQRPHLHLCYRTGSVQEHRIFIISN